MDKKLKTIIDSMDVKNNREQAFLTAAPILDMDPSVLKMLVKIGHSVKTNEADLKKRKKDLRAIIFLIAFFAQKKSISTQTLKELDVIYFLYELSRQGFQSAKKTLHGINIFESDILKDLLLSLPIVQTLDHDREISINEALEEIKTARLYSGPKGIQTHCFALGHDEKRSYGIYRIEKNSFVLRNKKYFK